MNAVKLAAAVCCVSILGTAAHAAGEPPALAPFAKFIDAMNAGDVKKAQGEFAASPTIIDEFAPHIWNSFASWNADLGKGLKADGVTDFHIALSPVGFKNVDAKTGYGVVPATLTFKVKGKPTTEKGMFTFTTKMKADSWRITGWAWSTL